MCDIHIRVHFPDTHSEVIVGDVEQTELAIESIVGTALLEVFDTVHVDDVRIFPSPGPYDDDPKSGKRKVKRRKTTGALP